MSSATHPSTPERTTDAESRTETDKGDEILVCVHRRLLPSWLSVTLWRLIPSLHLLFWLKASLRIIQGDKERDEILRNIETISQLIVQTQDNILAHQVKMAQALAQCAEARLHLESARARLTVGRIGRKAVTSKMRKSQTILCEAFSALVPDTMTDQAAEANQKKAKRAAKRKSRKLERVNETAT